MKNFSAYKCFFLILCFAAGQVAFGQQQINNKIVQHNVDVSSINVDDVDFVQVVENKIQPKLTSEATEIIEKRKINSRTFQKADGSFTEIVSNKPLFYKRGNSLFEYDNEIESNNTGSYPSHSYVNEKNSFTTFLPSSINNGLIAEFTNGNVVSDMNTPRMFFLDNNGDDVDVEDMSDALINSHDNVALYEEAYPNVDLKVSIFNDRRKADYIIKSADFLNSLPSNSQQLVFEETVTIPSGWTVELKNNIVLLSNSNNEVEAAYDFPKIYDSSLPASNLLDESKTLEELSLPFATYEIEQLSSNSFKLLLIVDVGWLSAPERVFPIVVDPDLIGTIVLGYGNAFGCYQNGAGYPTAINYNLNSSAPVGSTINTLTVAGTDYSSLYGATAVATGGAFLYGPPGTNSWFNWANETDWCSNLYAHYFGGDANAVLYCNFISGGNYVDLSANFVGQSPNQTWLQALYSLNSSYQYALFYDYVLTINYTAPAYIAIDTESASFSTCTGGESNVVEVVVALTGVSSVSVNPPANISLSKTGATYSPPGDPVSLTSSGIFYAKTDLGVIADGEVYTDEIRIIDDAGVAPSVSVPTVIAGQLITGNNVTAGADQEVCSGSDATLNSAFTNPLSPACLTFSDASHYLDCGPGSSLNISSSNITVEAWINPTSFRTNVYEGSIITNEDANSGYMLRCGASGTLNFNWGDGTTWNECSSASGVLTAGSWQHVAATYNGTTIKLYVNGSLVASSTDVFTGSASTNPLWIGHSPQFPSTRNFLGAIDEVRVWNVARTDRDIQALMNRDLAGLGLPSVNSPALKGYWNMNIGSGQSIEDVSGNGNDGFAVGVWNFSPPTELQSSVAWDNSVTDGVAFTPGATTTYTLTETTNDGCVSGNTDAVVVTVTVPGTWDGSTSTDWAEASNWACDLVPTSSSDVVVPDVTNQPSISSTVSVASLIVNSDADITVSSGSITVSGASDIDGTLSIASSAVFDADGAFDATGGSVTFTGSGRLQMSNTVTSLGSFTRSSGTVEYDGGSQTVLGMSASSGSSYNNLEIDGTGTKTMAATSKVYGDLILTAGDFDIDGNTVYLKSDMTRTAGNLISTGSGSVTMDNSAAHNICAFNDEDINLKATSTGGSVTTTGDITCKTIDLLSGSKTFLIAGQTINVEDDVEVTAGTLQITSGVLNINAGGNDVLKIDGGTFDLDGGTVNVGNTSSGDLDMTAGTLDVSGGTLNVVDQLSASSGAPTITQSGGTINIKSYVGSGGGTSTENKFDMDAGTLNLTGGTLNLQGQVSSASYFAMSIASGVTVNSGASHVTNVQSNNSTTHDEDMYLDLNGHDLGALTINLTGHDVYLGSAVGITGVLTLTVGNVITTASNKLTIENTAASALTTGSASSMIVGPIDRKTNSTDDYLLPVGDGTNYRPVVITPSATTATTYTAEFKNTAHTSISYDGNGNNNTPCTVPNDLDHVAMGCWWDIERTTSGSDCYVALNWDATCGVDTPNDIVLAHYNGSSWDKIGATLTDNTGSGSATASNGRVKSDLFVGDFSPFNLGSGSGGNNSLPIDLLSFHTECSHDIVDVNFSVVSQINNEKFLIERSTDALAWEVVGELPGVPGGNSNTQMDYLFTDNNPLANLSYYRLTQVDFDGKAKTFYPVSSSCGSTVGGLPVDVYPNPAWSDVTIEFELDQYQGDDVYYTITDATGKTVMSDYLELNKGFNKNTLDINKLPRGVYILRFNQTKDHITETRIVKK